MFDKIDKSSSFYFNGLAISIVQRQHKVEKVALSQVRRRLLLKVCTGQATTTARELETDR